MVSCSSSCVLVGRNWSVLSQMSPTFGCVSRHIGCLKPLNRYYGLLVQRLGMVVYRGVLCRRAIDELQFYMKDGHPPDELGPWWVRSGL